MTGTAPRLEGTLKVLPTLCSDILEFVAAEYGALCAEYGAKNVLVLKRHPAGLERVRAALSGESANATVSLAPDESTSTAGPRSPRLESLPEHASKVLEEYDPTLDRLEYEERIELISLVIDGASRDVPPYLERAADHESFGRDVGQLLLEATRQRLSLADDAEATSSGTAIRPDALHDCLEFLYAMNDRFHEVLASRGYVERADVVPQAVDLLEEDSDGVRSRVTSSFDAVLALEFEEFRRLDRQYLAALSGDATLVCLGEPHASTERTRVEPGSLEEIADGLAVESVVEQGADVDPDRDSLSDTRGTSDSHPPHRQITEFLATGRMTESAATDAQPGTARRIRARTRREQVDTVVTEIQSLRDRRDDIRYDDIAVAVPRVERVPETRTRLRDASIPTATIGVPSLAEDPAVNELYAFVTLQCARDVETLSDDLLAPESTRSRTGARADDPQTVAYNRLAVRVEDFSTTLLEECDGPSVAQSVERWLTRTDLKGRISRDEEWVDAREQFAGVRRVLEIARFVEETDLVGPDWEGLRRMLERTIRYDAPHVHTVDAQAPTGGVTVCSIDELAYDPHAVVFVLDLIEANYPGDPSLTQLFPTAWLRDMPNYPAVTDPSPAALERTFEPISDGESVSDPFETYHAQRARRRLAIGTRAATERLYCCSYERGSGGLRRTHEESRYLKLLEQAPDCSLEDVDLTGRKAEIYGESSALEALLEQPRGELDRILREASTGGDADLAETEALFEEIAVLLEEGDIDEELANAVVSQFEFAAGEVSRRE
ncbi:hypothetical protein HALLA_17440 [Halostagnicola larsenii XH-48]|uniref:Uncharacterized protein n=1 Tax=Halostagnicola larsenii XH-48 TaxID=797299 RepID=W0JTI7_9EURY|nr:hypothetical protein [Halostagnicola larsenii]AHG00318.1 hypothetical protein HALLA_17440 [Halostagnicola larsenii XH-48]